MPIVINLAQIMKKRGISSIKLAELIGITNVNLSRIKTGKIKAIRFSSLDGLCRELDCQPGDIMKYEPSVEVEEDCALLVDENDNPLP